MFHYNCNERNFQVDFVPQLAELVLPNGEPEPQLAGKKLGYRKRPYLKKAKPRVLRSAQPSPALLAGFSQRQIPSLKKSLTVRLTKLFHGFFLSPVRQPDTNEAVSITRKTLLTVT